MTVETRGDRSPDMGAVARPPITIVAATHGRLAADMDGRVAGTASVKPLVLQPGAGLRLPRQAWGRS